MAKNTIILFELTAQQVEISAIEHSPQGYRQLARPFIDTTLGTSRFNEQLLNLAMRKAGKYAPQSNEEQATWMAEAERCRKELVEFDTEFTFPDGTAVEIEQYEYENATTALTNRMQDGINRVMGNPAEIDKIILLAEDVDVALLKPLLIRNYSSSIGFCRSENEWLSVNDRATAAQLKSEANKAKTQQETAEKETPKGPDRKPAEQSRQASEAASRSTKQESPQRDAAPREPRQREKVQQEPRQRERVQPDLRQRDREQQEPRRPAPSQPAKSQKWVTPLLIFVGCALFFGSNLKSLFGLGRNTDFTEDEQTEVEQSATSDDFSFDEDEGDDYNFDDDTDIDFSSDEGEETESVESQKPGRATSNKPTDPKKRYDYVYSECDGLRKVEKNGKKGFIDANGREVVAPIYDYIYSRSEGLYKVERNGKKGFIRPDGTVFMAVKYDYIYSKADGVYKVEVGKKKGFVDARTGKELCPPKYDYIYSKTDGLYKVELNKKKGLLNADFKEIVPPKYDYIYSFSGGLAKVEQNGKVGYINKEGKLVQPLE